MKIQDVTDFIHFASTETKIDAAKAVGFPAAGGTGFVITGDMVVLILTIVLLTWQLLLLIPKTIREYKEFKKDRLKP